MTPPSRHCIVIPFLDRLDAVANCLRALLAQRTSATHVLLVDDGSEPAAAEHPALQDLLAEPRVHLIRHEHNRGVAAARNSGVHWCRRNGFDLAIMIDSDCLPGPELIPQHLQLQTQFPDATAIAGAVVGSGRGVFAWIDALLTWTNSRPFGHVRTAGATAIYHLPMPNIAFRLSRLPQREFLFDERLNTGEDTLLIRELRHSGHSLVSSPRPVVLHQDRDTFRSLLNHHREWGHHQYFVQLGGDFSRPVFDPLYRAVFFLAFALTLPLYVLLGSLLNVLPWVRHRPAAILALPAAMVIWLLKGLAVMRAAATPRAVLRPTRACVEYVEGTQRNRGRLASGARGESAVAAPPGIAAVALPG